MQRQDADALAARLGVTEAAVQPIMAGLSAWHRSQLAASTVGSWRYRLCWLPLTGGQPKPLAGPWLVVTPAEADPDTARAVTVIAGALADHDATVIRIAAAGADRAALAAARRAGLVDQRPAGVLSLVALGASGAAEPGDVPPAVAGTVTLLQALHDAEITAPCWCVTSGAVAVSRFEDVSPAAASLWGMGTVLALDQPGSWGGLADLADPADLGRRRRPRQAAGRG